MPPGSFPVSTVPQHCSARGIDTASAACLVGQFATKACATPFITTALPVLNQTRLAYFVRCNVCPPTPRTWLRQPEGGVGALSSSHSRRFLGRCVRSSSLRRKCAPTMEILTFKIRRMEIDNHRPAAKLCFEMTSKTCGNVLQSSTDPYFDEKANKQKVQQKNPDKTFSAKRFEKRHRFYLLRKAFETNRTSKASPKPNK